MAEGDTVIIKDYPDTSGSYIPPTPTKLGMYPKFKPEQYTDNSYQTATSVIRRHDGSIIKSGAPAEIISDDTVKSVYLGASFNL